MPTVNAARGGAGSFPPPDAAAEGSAGGIRTSLYTATALRSGSPPNRAFFTSSVMQNTASLLA